jgi:cytochrome oxidase Cu insertion factor (SCO1/SenC/PrrC family)
MGYNTARTWRALLAIALASGSLCGAVPAWIEDAAAVGIPVGAKAPVFELQDQSGRKRTLASLMERRGLVLVFFRSADW